MDNQDLIMKETLNIITSFHFEKEYNSNYEYIAIISIASALLFT